LLEIPTTSSTWKLLSRLFPGGQAALLAEHRFIDTVLSGGSSVALIFVPIEASTTLLDGTWQPLGRHYHYGVVVEATHAGFKRATYRLHAESMGELEVICYHKASNLLRAGDRVAVRGWLLGRGEERRLIQMLLIPDNIVWHGKGAG
jgi:hypothetical protein